MAYLPFYLTPEEFEAYQEEQEKQIKQGLHTHEWSCHNIEEPNRYGAFQFTVLSLIPVALMMAYVGYIGYIKLNGFAAFCVLVLFCTLTYAWYLTVGVDNHYRYVLSEFGFVQKKNRAEPEWVNKVMLIIAWVSAIGCLVAVSVAGPMALAGSGVLILFAFSMMKRQPQNSIETCVSMREHWLKVQYNKQRKVIVLYHKFDDCEYEDVMKTRVIRYHSVGDSYLFCNSIPELEAIINSFKNRFNFECTEIKNHTLLFGADTFPNEVAALPFRGTSYPVKKVFELRAKNAPLPDWEYR